MARSTPRGSASVRSEVLRTTPEESRELRKSYLNMRIERLSDAIDEKTFIFLFLIYSYHLGGIAW